MLIVSGWIQIAPGQRDRFLADSYEAMVLARRSPGCRAFIVAAELEAFRGTGPSGEQTAVIVDAAVARHLIASSGPA